MRSSGNTSYQKSTVAQFNQRVLEIEELLLQGFSRAEIIRYASEGIEDAKGKVRGGWKVSSRQTDTYIRHAEEHIDESMRVGRQKRTRQLLAKHHRLYRKLYAAGDYKGATVPLKEIAALGGNYAPVKHELRDPSKMTEAELKAEIAELMLDYEKHGKAVESIAKDEEASRATGVSTAEATGVGIDIGSRASDGDGEGASHTGGGGRCAEAACDTASIEDRADRIFA